MKILLLGATGRTGQHLLEQSLKRGHDINILVRDKTKITVNNPHLSIFEGSPLDKAMLGAAMKNCEAIVSALNVSRKSDWPWAGLRSPADFLSATMKNIIELAPAHQLQRVIVTSAWGVAETKKDIPGWFRWMIDHSNIRYPYLDHERQEELLKQSSLQYTAVRAAGLTNSKKKKRIIVSIDNKPKPRLMISRSNLADFMLDILEKDLYKREMVVVS